MTLPEVVRFHRAGEEDEDCDGVYFDYEVSQWKVCLIRHWPKNKGQTPAEWLEGHDESLGLYDVIDRMQAFTSETDKAYYITYRGADTKTYSQPMFTAKVNTEACLRCERGPDAWHHRTLGPLETWHPAEYRDRTIGCLCGDLSELIDCPDHPLPGIDSRWVRKNMPPGMVCSQCHTELPVNGKWLDGQHYYCSSNCYSVYEKKYKRITEG